VGEDKVPVALRPQAMVAVIRLCGRKSVGGGWGGGGGG